jgi:hypothetical protein
MPIPILPILAIGAVHLLLRRKATPASSGSITVFKGEGGNAPTTIELERDEMFAIEFWGEIDQVWTFDTELPKFGSLKQLESKFARTPHNGEIPTFFVFRARSQGTVQLKFSLHDAQVAAAAATVSIETKVK